ncbi:glycosyl hydrolase [Paractinoplanes deccanensis]|uniref:Glycosyl hydrolase n=1 Tax=Paractinoplanes deccanensis TaxID=113561 RepID=A0ABQ3YB57_9ACTN|nr:chitinase [Actinoplanes deccanensis]GID77240.1 glycosyl hydrolase [Actinoplanes deccanensis]
MSSPDSAAEPRRRLSVPRILLVVVVVAAAVCAPFAFRTVKDRLDAGAAQVSSFAPYVDVTNTPQFSFEDASANAAGTVVLGFVVSSTDVVCRPSWGTAYSLATASTGIDLDRRIARLRQRGGDVTVSFGGASNKELASACTDPAKLQAAYEAVVDRYGITSVDFDLEDGGETAAVMARRAAAVRAVQRKRVAAGKSLDVWLTLPVGTAGLTSVGVAELDAMLAAGVEVAGVNALTMNYGSPGTGRTMTSLVEASLTSLAGQVVTSYRKIGTTLSAEEGWQRVAATPMIGQNDTADERFQLSDASALLAFAREKGLRRLSMWSANRDNNCGVNYVDTTIVSTSCSGLDQERGAFTALFNEFTATTPTKAPASAAAPPSDDPATSPYPIWNELTAYAKNAKVVWHHNVYLAKWWTQGDTPDAPVTNAADTPWTLLGPVLAGETPLATGSSTVTATAYATWNPAATYVAGDRVQYHNVVYQAKWWTLGDVPGAAVSDPSDTPWEKL